jgi:hypothetical protein
MKIAKKFNRCLEFTLPDGTIVTAKVLGDKAEAAKACTALHTALTAEAK